MDDLIYEELKGTGNMEVHLDRKFAEKRIYPAVDVTKSGTRHEELIYDKDTLSRVTTLRRMMALRTPEEGLMALIDKLPKTKNNKEFLETLHKA
jgi:transcription termination factor Rho